jgi:hypothetical protein
MLDHVTTSLSSFASNSHCNSVLFVVAVFYWHIALYAHKKMGGKLLEQKINIKFVMKLREKWH